MHTVFSAFVCSPVPASKFRFRYPLKYTGGLALAGLGEAGADSDTRAVPAISSVIASSLATSRGTLRLMKHVSTREGRGRAGLSKRAER